MNDQATQSDDEGNGYSEALLQSAIERIKARGDSVKRFAVMQLPGHLFNDLCARLLDRKHSVKSTAEWLAGQSDEAPTRQAVERFSDVLYEEYRMAQLSERRQTAERYVQASASGNPDATQMALNTRLTELLTDELMRADDAEGIDTKRLMALMMGARVVAQTAMDKQKMDARITALETSVRKAEKEIELKDQRLAQLPAKIKALTEKLSQVETAVAQGKKIDPKIYTAMRAQLVAMAKIATPPAPTPALAAGGNP